jgi:hypothetical protein
MNISLNQHETATGQRDANHRAYLNGPATSSAPNQSRSDSTKNSFVESWNAAYRAAEQAKKDESERLRSLDLCEVLTRIYGAVESADSRPTYRTRKFKVNEHGSIAVTGDLWIDNRSGEGGKGAVNLVMHVEDWPRERAHDAFGLLAEHFGSGYIPSANARKAASNGPAATPRPAPEPFAMPEPVEENWPRARHYLEEVRKIPAALIDWAYDRDLIFADSRSNLVFVRDGGEGCFKRGSYDPKDRSAFKQTLGRDAGPMVLPGTDGRVFVAEGPTDAFALKAINPASTVLATGGNFPSARLQPYLDRYATERVFLAHDNDSAGNDQAQRLKDAYKPLGDVDVVRWSTSIEDAREKDWSAVLMARPSLSTFELDQRGEIVSPESHQEDQSIPRANLGCSRYPQV